MGNRRRSCSKRVTNTLVAGALVLGGSGAVAATPDRLYQDEVADEAGSVEADELTDDGLHGFIEAAHEIQSIRAEYAEKVSEAKPSERAALQAEAAEKMAEAIEDQGLDVSEYREIGWLLENDAELPDRLDRVAATES
jgi:hypothetical protein